MAIELQSLIKQVINDASDFVFKDEIGKVFRIYAGEDMSGATSVIMKVKKLSGTEVEWAAAVDSTNPRYITYTTVSGDLNETGIWQLSLQIVKGGATHIGETVQFTVFDQFEDNNVVPSPH